MGLIPHRSAGSRVSVPPMFSGVNRTIRQDEIMVSYV
jgi:hypothetical protein